MEINRQEIEFSGGLFLSADNNIANRNTLEYIIDAIDGEMFGQPLYPSVHEKAAFLGWNIAAKHVFHDGNKRTGLLSCQIFLDINGYDLHIATAEEDIEASDTMVAIASGNLSLEDFTVWVGSRINK